MKKKISLVLMAMLYIVAGLNHFRNPGFYLKIMPHYIPAHEQIVFWTGVLEILLGGMLFLTKTRKISSVLIILMLIAFLPLHIQMIIDSYTAMDKIFIISMIRLPLQFVLIRWAYKVGKFQISGRVE